MQLKKSKVRSLGIIILGVVIVVGSFYLMRAITKAGTLTPSAAPAGTMRTLQEIYNVLASGSSVTASSTAASSTGNAIQIAQCMITKLTGGSCP